MRHTDRLVGTGDAVSAAGQGTGRKPKSMATVGESLRKLISAHVQGDREAFSDAARELISEQRAKQHDALARDLERILEGQESSNIIERRAMMPLARVPVDDLPRDKEKGLALIEIREPLRRIEDLVLDTEVLMPLQRVLLETFRAELLRSHGLRPMNRVLFCGPPGCGKTVTAEAMASELRLPLAVVRFDAVVSSYLGETAANLRKIFDFIKDRTYVVLFDEFDAIGKSRTNVDDHGELKRVVSAFLQLLDQYRGQSLLIAATNHEGMLDAALWRRFDEVVTFGKPNQRAIEEMLARAFRQIGIAPTIRITTISNKLAGMAHADVERIAIGSLKSTIMRDDAVVSEETIRAAIARQEARAGLTASKALERTRQRRRPKAKSRARKRRK